MRPNFVKTVDNVGAMEGSGMGKTAVSRRGFLGSASGVVAAAAVVGSVPAIGEAAASSSSRAEAPNKKKKIPIGVFDPAYPDLSLDEMLDKVSALGLEAMEVGTGGYPNSAHCPVADLLADAGKAKAWKKKFEDKNIRIGAFSCHGNPIHPDPKHAATDAESFRHTVLLAERLEIPVIVGFSGCPGGNPNRHHAELGDVSLAPRIWTDARLAVERKSHSLLARGREIRAPARYQEACF
jgi:hypothetical protein